MRNYLHRKGYNINRKRVQRLMRKMGLQSVVPSPEPASRILNTRCIHTFFGVLMYRMPIMSGALIWHISALLVDLSVWQPLWTCIAVMCSPGRYQYSWAAIFVYQFWNVLFAAMAHPIYSTLIRDPSIPVVILLELWKIMTSRSVWTVRSVPWTNPEWWTLNLWTPISIIYQAGP